MFKVNVQLDNYLLRPVAKGYPIALAGAPIGAKLPRQSSLTGDAGQ